VQTFRQWREERKAQAQKRREDDEADRKRKGILTGREIFMQVRPPLYFSFSVSTSDWAFGWLLAMQPAHQPLGHQCERTPCYGTGIIPSTVSQEGFMAEDDAGATDAYERENDDEEEIRRMDEEAAARRAAEASAAATAAGSSAPGASGGANASSSNGAIIPPKCVGSPGKRC